jgi:oxygen-independent coproporphyrinogen III oxidase
VDSEKQARQFLLLMQWMEAAGYEHYEISNFAKPGMRSKHNSSYWSGSTYYGFGPSAHSFNGKSRQWNIANNALYITSLQKNTIPFEEEILTATQQLNEYIMTSLRTMEGLDDS